MTERRASSFEPVVDLLARLARDLFSLRRWVGPHRVVPHGD